jgi:predicted deacylase
VLDEGDLPFHWAGLVRPTQVTDESVLRVRARRGGLFLPERDLWEEVERGARLGTVIDPASGEHLEEVTSPAEGRLLALREHPVVFPGSMVGRVVIL